MEDLQLNISVARKNVKKVGESQKNVEGYKFTTKPNIGGKIIARKRPQNSGKITFSQRQSEEPQKKVPKLSNAQPAKADDLATKLRDLSENKGKFQGQNYQQISDDLQVKQKPRSGAWISSLFKNNPEVPRIGQRAVKPVLEKVFAGRTFEDLNIHPHSVANLQQNMNLTELMTVQQKAIPVILQGRDVLIRSQTGSGKTLAYALPAIEALQAIRPKVSRHDGIRVVVVVPTRELAVQTYELFVKLTKPFIWIVPGLLSGGQKRKAEKARLRKGLNILVGTPGRINDHLRHTHSLNFAKVGILILDEADRLLDMGYEKDVAAIVKAIEDHKNAATYNPMALVKQTIAKKMTSEEETQSSEINNEKIIHKHQLTEVLLSTERQTILLSATLTKAVENLAGITMKEPVFVDTAEGKAVVADSLKCKENQKSSVYKSDVKTEVLERDDRDNSTKDEVEDLESNKDKRNSENDSTLSKRGLKAFNGSAHPDLFVNNSTKPINNDDNVKKLSITQNPKTRYEHKGDSDSDDEKQSSFAEDTKEFSKKINKYVLHSDVDSSKRGLKAFNSSAHMDLFSSNTCSVTNDINVKTQASKQEQTNTAQDSDSGSDYEYFKVQKELEVKKLIEDNSKDLELASDKASSDKGNKFLEAVQTAIKEDELVLPATVNQTFLIVPMKLRLVTLCSLIIEHCVLNKKGGKLIVFMATTEMVDYHAELIETVLTGKEDKKKDASKKFKRKKKEGEDDKGDSNSSEESEFELDYDIPEEGSLVPVDVDVFSLHGSMPHERRMEVFKQFRQANHGLLICSDVAARGIDVPRVDLVLQYCAPGSVTDYVHRVGRTGRAAAVGAAVMFLLPSEAEFVRHLEQKRIRLRQADESKALEPLRTVVPSAHSVQRAAIGVQARLEHVAHSSRDWLARASRAYTSWVRFYSAYPREVRVWLDARQLHLGHAAKAFALRDTPAALARRTKNDPNMKREKPMNRLTLRDEEARKRPGFPKVKIGAFGNRVINKQSSMHTASEFDSGLPAVDTYNRDRRNKKKKIK